VRFAGIIFWGSYEATFQCPFAHFMIIRPRIDAPGEIGRLDVGLDTDRMAGATDNGIGARLKALRAARGLTLHRLAGQCGLTRGYLSLVERDLKTPSLAALLRITEALATDVGTLFNGRHDATPDYVLYRRSAAEDASPVTPLAPARHRKAMEPFIVRPTAEAVERATHSGEELIVVLRGEVLIRLGTEDMVLRPGDSLYFSASIQHSIRRLGAASAEVLVVVGRPAGRAEQRSRDVRDL
jgi:transcriptional regulator with XRE-family HTH domain